MDTPWMAVLRALEKAIGGHSIGLVASEVRTGIYSGRLAQQSIPKALGTDKWVNER